MTDNIEKTQKGNKFYHFKANIMQTSKSKSYKRFYEAAKRRLDKNAAENYDSETDSCDDGSIAKKEKTFCREYNTVDYDY